MGRAASLKVGAAASQATAASHEEGLRLSARGGHEATGSFQKAASQGRTYARATAAFLSPAGTSVQEKDRPPDGLKKKDAPGAFSPAGGSHPAQETLKEAVPWLPKAAQAGFASPRTALAGCALRGTA